MKTILFTGATDGIGLAAVQQLVAKGHKVLIHGRSPSKLKTVADQLGLGSKDDQIFVADLSDLKQVYQMAKDVKDKHDIIDVLVNNAGVFKLPPDAVTTNKDGMDLRFAVNTVAPYILTKELLTLIPNHGRVINLSSAAQAPVDVTQALPSDGIKKPARFDNDFAAYAQSKLGIIMWTNVFAASAANASSKIVFASLNPASMIGTKMVREGFGVEGKSLDVGADILVEASVGKKFGDFHKANGKYFDNDRGQFGSPHPGALDVAQNEMFVQAMDEWLEKVYKQPSHN